MKKLIISIAFLIIILLSACSISNPNSTINENNDKFQNSPAIQTVNKTSEDLKKAIEQKRKGSKIDVLDITDVGNNFVLVNYDIPTSTNSYALCNTQTGAIELLPVTDVKLLEIKGENYFVFENRGEYTDSAFRFIPTICHCFRIDYSEDGGNFVTLRENELFELDRTIQFGSKNNILLSSIVTTLDGFEIIFKPSNDDDKFYVPAPDVPKTITSYDAKKNQITFEFSTNIVSADIKYDTEYEMEDNLYLDSYKLLLNGNKTDIVFTLKDSVKRYAVIQKFGPEGKEINGSFPYISVTFSG